MKIVLVNMILDFIMKIFQINKYFKEQLFIISGSSILLYLFYIRVIHKHLPKELNKNLMLTAKIIFIYLFIIMIIMFVITLRKYYMQYVDYKPKKTIETNFIFRNIKHIIGILVTLGFNSLLAIHKLIINYMDYDYINNLNLYFITKIGIKHIYKLKIFLILYQEFVF